MMSLTELRGDIEEAAKKDFLDVRIKAMNALIHLDSDGAMELLGGFVHDGSDEDKRVYLAVAGLLNEERNLPFVEKLLSDHDLKIRGAVSTVIGNFIDDERYMNMFVRQLMEDDIPHEVLKVIKEKKLSRFKERLKEIFDDRSKGLWTRYYALSALSSFTDHSLFETFTEGLEDENSIIKIGCLRALSDLNDMRALDYVMPFVQSTDEDVSSTAEFVINKLEAF
jgi:HEAT repeat protein